MEENTVVAFRNPSNFQDDPLTEVLRAGARELLAQAVEAEVAEFLEGHATLVDDRGRRRIVRNGHLPERLIQTGIGPVDVRQPRVRDRRAGEGAGAIRFTSAILPRYLRRTKSLEDLLPWLYLRGISSGDFSEALAALLGAQAPGLSASTIGRLKEVWQDEMERWQRRDLSAKRYVYFWVDGIYFGARLEEEKQCILVIIGATDHGTKELIAITDGYRESEQSWREVLLDLKRRGLGIGPELVTGDGALGFWKALRQVYGAAREQRCWVRAVQRSLLRVIAEQPVESADGISISRVGHVGDVVGAHDVGGETADASENAGVFADATGVLAHGDITRIVVPVFNPPVCPDGAAGGVGGEHGVRHVVGGFAGQVPEAGRGVAFEAAAVDPNDGGDKGCPFGVAEMGARIEDLDVARLVSRPRGVDGLMAVERLALVA